MSHFSAKRFLKNATPQPGDPTFSILRTHLLIEDLLRTYLERVAVTPAAISKAKLSFAQVLQVTRAFCPYIKEDHWMWKAMADLNKLRNELAHSLDPKDMEAKLDAYMSLVIDSSSVPFPEPAIPPGTAASSQAAQIYASDGYHNYYKLDMANIGLCASVAGALDLYSKD